MTGAVSGPSKKQPARKLELLKVLPASYSAVLARRHRSTPIWSKKSFLCTIKSSYLMWKALEADDLNLKPLTLQSKYIKSFEEIVDLRECEVQLLPASKKGFPFTIVPKKSRSITFMASSEHAREIFVSHVLQASQTISLNDFKIVSVIGRGFFGTILAAYKKNDPAKKLYALKEIKLSILRSRSRIATIQGERAILQKVAGNPFVVGLEFAFVTSTALYLVMELMEGGDFLNTMKLHKGKLPKEAVQFYAAQLLLGLQHLHSLNIVHRDLKPENILVDKEGHLRITDLGLSKQLKESSEVSHTFCGTDAYLAPEMLNSDSNRAHGKAVDFWQYGSLVFEMFSGRPPFYKRNISRHEIHEAILYSEPELPSHIPEDAASLIKLLLEKDPAKRLTNWEEVKSHPFFDTLDWYGVSSKKISPPVSHKPSDEYLKNFDESLTSIPLRIEPATDGAFDDFFGFEYTRPEHEYKEVDPAASSRKLKCAVGPQQGLVVLAVAT